MLCLHKRRKYKDYAFLEWTTNATLQLHRLTHEELQVGTWSGCTDNVPVTKTEDLLASLDIGDLEHPVLALPTHMAVQESKKEASPTVMELEYSASTADNSPRTTQSANIQASDAEVQNHIDGPDEVDSTTQPSTNVQASETRGGPNEEHEPETPNERHDSSVIPARN
jgi:hypothetical protein